jgi:DAK2 domain fusion protein YloV
MSRRAADGRGLLGAFCAAVDNLAAHVDEVNALNVFPVPDGDTGSNMLATVRAALAEAERADPPTADRIAQAISFGALMGARGNSGVIASQIFRGMADALGGKHYFDGHDLAHSLNQGAATAYRAVVKPVEGTILTVIREASVAASEKSEAGGDLAEVLAAAVSGAQAAVAKTPSLLPILKDAGVVDAGGQGLFRLLQGAQLYLEERVPSHVQREADRRRAGLAAGSDAGAGAAAASATGEAEAAEEEFGYETMFLLRARRDPIDVDSLRAALEEIGESVLVAGDSRAVKVHVHNDSPDAVIALGLSLGSLTRITVENLDAQSSDVREKKAAEMVAAPIDHRLPGARHDAKPPARVDLETFGVEVTASASKSNGNGSVDRTSEAETTILNDAVPLAVVAVTTGEGLSRIFESYGVAAIVHGGQTSNPSTGELLDAVERIAADEILLLPNNPNVVLAARQASEMTSRRVRVVPTRNAAEGFAALIALDPSRDATANAEVMTLAGRAVQTLQVTEAVRDAMVGGQKVRKGQTIVLDPDDGLLAAGNDRSKAVLGALDALEPGFELITLYWGDGADEADARAMCARIRETRPGVEVEVVHGGQPHYRYLISAE